VLPLEQRRVAAREPPLEQRSEGQPGYSEELRVHLPRHRAPISASQPTDIPDTDIPATRSRAVGTQATRDTPLTPVLRAMDTQVIRVSPLPPDPRPMDTQVIRVSPLPPDPRPMGTQATRDNQLPPAHRTMDTRADRCTPPIPVPDIPWLAIGAITLREDWSPGAEYAIEPSS
jgi:hypothetical protein